MQLNLGDYDTEHEAAYAYNVAYVLLNDEIPLLELNIGLTLSGKQRRSVEDKVCGIVRKELGLPKDFRFPANTKSILNTTLK